MEKKCKLGAYFGGLIKKYGLATPVLSALAIFAAMYYVRFVEMFDGLDQQSPLSYWLTIACALIGIILIVIFIAARIKSEELVFQDALLLTFDFLMVFLLVGMIIFEFVSLETVYYAAALIALVVLNILRIKYFVPSDSECDAQSHKGNMEIKKYYGAVIGKFGFWKLLLAAFFALCVFALSSIRNFPELFLSQASYTVGLLLVAALAGVALVFALVKRIRTCDMGAIDGFLMFALFTVVLAIVQVIIEFTILKFMIWLFALIANITLLNILALNTYEADMASDSAYFATKDYKNYKKGPKIYFKHFYESFNLFVLGAIALFVFAALNAITASGFFIWAKDNGFIIYTVIGILLFGIGIIAFLARSVKNRDIGIYDAVLAVMDVALLLLTITIFGNYGENSLLYVILWALFLVISIAFSITRLFMVKEPISELQADEAVEDTKLE